MDFVKLTQILAVAGLALGILGILLRINAIMRRPFKQDLARARGQVRRGILYAFTLGMAPWEKESTRRHWVAYIRGILFHVGIFMGFAVLLASPWLERMPDFLVIAAAIITGIGAIAGFFGVWLRWGDRNERVLSIPDDYISVILTSLFTTLAFIVLFFPGAIPVLYLVTAILGIYMPLSKIRHCVYFFYSKFFFGSNFGRRGVIGQSKSKYAE